MTRDACIAAARKIARDLHNSGTHGMAVIVSSNGDALIGERESVFDAAADIVRGARPDHVSAADHEAKIAVQLAALRAVARYKIPICLFVEQYFSVAAFVPFDVQ